MRFLVWGMMLLAGAVGQSLTFPPVFLSPLRRMRVLPTSAELPTQRDPAVGPLVPSEP